MNIYRRYTLLVGRFFDSIVFVRDMQHICNRYHIFFAYKDIHFTLLSFMQIQDIEVIFILSLVFNILKFSYKWHVQLKTISNITYSTFSNSSYLKGKGILEPRLIIVGTWQLCLNTQKETITMLPMENFFVLATLFIFIFRAIVSLLPSD